MCRTFAFKEENSPTIMAREQINNSSKNERGSWDAYKLVREYVGIAWMLNYSEQLENLPWDNQVRVQRVASAICAFLSKDAVAIKLPYSSDEIIVVIPCVFLLPYSSFASVHL